MSESRMSGAGYAGVTLRGGEYNGAPTVTAPAPTGHFDVTLNRLRKINADASNVADRLNQLSSRLLGPQPLSAVSADNDKPASHVAAVARELATTEALIEMSRNLLRALEDEL